MDYIALGCMTGTSLDGIDCSLVKTDGATYLNNIANEFTPYSKNLRDRLSRVLVHNYLTDPSLLKSLSNEYKVAINNLINKYDEKIDVIGIHGQTVLHDPSLKLSLQLYDKSSLYNTHAPIICNFRKNDILNGGLGAPILPVYHQIISQQNKMSQAIFVNIGGVSNITLIDEDDLIAGDTSFGNAIINDYLIKNCNLDLDLNGEMSRNGKKIDSLYNHITNDLYFNKKLPKSLDRNYFHHYLNNLPKTFEARDIIFTLLSIIPESIKKLISPQKEFHVILSGGGRKNLTLVNLFKKKFSNVSLIDDFQIDGDFIESQGMGLLATRYLQKIPSTFEYTTGLNKSIYLGERC
jgi:anhydro-N-acetylmuramic acid kinase